MPTVLLIRHGENDSLAEGRLVGRAPGVNLNEKGRAQAEVLAEKLASVRIRAVYSSPMERATQTAAPIAEALDLPVTPRPGLNETDFGTWQGKTFKQLRLRKLWRVVQSAPSLARFPDGESFAEVQGRICHEIETLCAQHRPKDNFVCVSHGDPIRLAVAYYIGLPLDCFQRLIVAPASITTLHIGEAGVRLINLNHTLPTFSTP